jgi:hypothetical protein
MKNILLSSSLSPKLTDDRGGNVFQFYLSFVFPRLQAREIAVEYLQQKLERESFEFMCLNNHETTE